MAPVLHTGVGGLVCHISHCTLVLSSLNVHCPPAFVSLNMGKLSISCNIDHHIVLIFTFVWENHNDNMENS